MPFRTSRPARKRTARVVVGAALIGVALMLYVTGVNVPRVFSDVAHGLLRGLWSMGQDAVPSAALDAEIAALQAENMTLRRDLLASRIDEQAETGGTDAPGAISASVLTSPALLPEDIFILDRGEGAGVREGALVVDRENGFAVGYVARALSDSAVVYAFSSPRAEGIAILEGDETMHVTTVGKGSGTLEITLPRGVVIAEGDRLLLPGRARIALAHVAHVEPEPEAALVRGLARMYAAVPSTTRVYVYTTLVWRVTEPMLEATDTVIQATTTDHDE